MLTFASIAFGAGRTAETLSKLPLSFEPNLGQGQKSAQYLARGAGYSVALLSSGVSMNFVGDRGRPQTVGVRLEGASNTVRPVANEPLAGKVNYFLGSDRRRWRTDIPTFGQVKYPEVYAGIDVIYYGQQNRLEFDFRLRPGADPSQIRLRLNGGLPRIDRNGDLVIGQWRQHKPVAYQLLGPANLRTPVECSYILHGQAVTLKLGQYDRRAELIIDPVVTYATYLGGNSNDAIAKIKVDAAGSLYICGSTTSSGASTGAQSYGGSNSELRQMQFGDAFVAKLNTAGTALVYAAYLGGSGDDLATSLAIDSSGSAYVAGSTQSNNFPVTTGAFQTSYKGFTDENGVYDPGDGFLVKLNAAGNQLVYATYLGGALNDLPIAVTVTPAGNAVVAGSTNSTDFPTTANAYARQFRGRANFGPSVAGDGFLTVMNATGTALVNSTFIGGRSKDAASGVALDAQGNMYVCGVTFSGDFPTTPGAFQTTFRGLETSTDYNAAAGDAFVAKFTAQGALVYSSYLGGSLREAATSIIVGSDGAAYVTGITSSANFPATANAPQKTYGGDRAYGTVGNTYYGDGFLAKLDPAGATLSYATYLGGKGDEAGMDVAVDALNNAYVVGFTTSNEFPVTADALQKTNAGLGGQGFAPNASQGFSQERVRNTGDAFFTKFAANGSLVYSSYFGGGRDDAASAVAVDLAGNAYVAGSTLSPGISTPATAQTTFGGAGTNYPRGDGFIVKFGFGGVLPGLPSLLKVVGEFTGTGAPGAVLSTPFTVEVTDAQGVAVPGVTVSFAATNATVSPTSAVSNAQGRASATVTLGPAAGAGTLTASANGITAVTAALTIGATSNAIITGINTAWGGTDIAQNTFIEIKGTNLVPGDTTAGGVIWNNAPEFQSGRMPTRLGGVSVTVNGKPAFVYFFCSKVTTPACATDQINVLTPLDDTVGPVSVIVTSGSASTAAFTAQLKTLAPTFLLFSPAGSIIATHADFSYLGPVSLFPGASTPASVGETIVTYSIGYALPRETLTNGSATQTGSLLEVPVCRVNNVAAPAAAALIAPGLYQLNITIPAGARNGDNAIGCTYRGVSTPAVATVAVSVP